VAAGRIDKDCCDYEQNDCSGYNKDHGAQSAVAPIVPGELTNVKMGAARSPDAIQGRPALVRQGAGLPPNSKHGQGEIEMSKVPSSPPPPVNVERTDRDDGITFGIAMSVAFLIRDRDEPSIAREWWDAAGLTIEQCEGVGLDEYDLAPIRAGLAATATGGSDRG
jgi:hypothetical protein